MQSVGNWQIDTEQSQNGVIFSCLKRQRSLRESVTILLKGKYKHGTGSRVCHCPWERETHTSVFALTWRKAGERWILLVQGVSTVWGTYSQEMGASEGHESTAFSFFPFAMSRNVAHQGQPDPISAFRELNDRKSGQLQPHGLRTSYISFLLQ